MRRHYQHNFQPPVSHTPSDREKAIALDWLQEHRQTIIIHYDPWLRIWRLDDDFHCPVLQSQDLYTILFLAMYAPMELPDHPEPKTEPTLADRHQAGDYTPAMRTFAFFRHQDCWGYVDATTAASAFFSTHADTFALSLPAKELFIRILYHIGTAIRSNEYAKFGESDTIILENSWYKRYFPDDDRHSLLDQLQHYAFIIYTQTFTKAHTSKAFHCQLSEQGHALVQQYREQQDRLVEEPSSTDTHFKGDTVWKQ